MKVKTVLNSVIQSFLQGYTRRQEDLTRPWGIVFILFVLYTVGIISHGLDSLYQLMLFITPGSLLLFGLLAFLPYALRFSTREGGFFLFTFAVTLALEIIGVKTGLIFGEYLYGPTLGWQLGGVPLIIGFNWVIVIFGSHALTQRLFTKAWQRIPATGILAFFFDYLLEPIAIRLDYWQWAGGDIPVQNYIAWGLIASFIALGLEFFPVKTSKKLIISYVFLQVYFFIGLHLLL